MEIQNPKSKIVQDPGSSYLITVQMEPQYEDKLDADRLHRLAIHVLTAEGAEGPLELGVVVTTDEEVLALNRQYLGHDYNTDVLSFSMGEGEEIESGGGFVTPAERAPYLGDVVISYERATEQAPDYNHSTEAEVATLLVHGLLHLLGYDDTEDEQRGKMHTRQEELISSFGS
ncbi:MAG TPA: rRNA maturation RNase YbeY [Chloroflexia bacterium]|nr:rRNA maturation RNase YbeY [Chloroflexia bacterium]